MENKKRYIGIDMSKRSIETVFILKTKNYSLVSFLFAKLLKEKTASKVFVLNAGKLLGYYAGLVPRVDCSGEQNKYSSITKRGPRELRRLLNQAAWSLVRSKQPCRLLMFYKRISARSGYKKAIVALSRKLIELFYTLHKKQVLFFDPFLEANPSNVEKKLAKYELVDEFFHYIYYFLNKKHRSK